LTAEIAVDGSTTRRQRIREWASRWLVCDGESIPKRSEWPASLQRVHAYGLLAIVVFFFALAVWSSVIARRFSLTFDYSFYGQAWYLIAHGHLDPYATTVGAPYWHNAFELVIYPLAPLWYLWPHAVTLLWAQDAATAGCEAVLFIWMCEFTARGIAERRLRPWSTLIAACGAVLLVVTPWTIWINSFDFHPDAIDLLVALLAAHAFWRGHPRRAWGWVVASLLCGAIGATYVAGVGISAALAGRRWRRVGAVLVAVGLVWLVLLSHIGADHASGVYADLTKGTSLKNPPTNTLIRLLIEHPSRALSAIWSVRLDLYADVASGGVIGLFSPWAFGVTFLVLLEDALTGSANFAEPYIQNSLPVVLLVPFGTVTICLALAAARRRWKHVLSVALAVLAVANVAGWALVWSHRAEQKWLSIPTKTAATLQVTLATIPTNDEVIASQGIIGRFAFRPWIYKLDHGPASTFPVHGRTVWFVFTPYVGYETESGVSAQAQIGQLLDRDHARLVTDANGVYVLKWQPRAGQSAITFSSSPTVPAWSLPYVTQFKPPSGPVRQWHVTTNQPGYVVLGGVWSLPDGRWSASVRFASFGPVQVQVWDDTTDQVLGEKTFASTGGVVEERSFTGRVVNTEPPSAYDGAGIFKFLPIEPPPVDTLDVRVENQGHNQVSVYSLALAHTPDG
jgi:hypothetical protein